MDPVLYEMVLVAVGQAFKIKQDWLALGYLQTIARHRGNRVCLKAL